MFCQVIISVIEIEKNQSEVLQGIICPGFSHLGENVHCQLRARYLLSSKRFKKAQRFCNLCYSSSNTHFSVFFVASHHKWRCVCVSRLFCFHICNCSSRYGNLLFQSKQSVMNSQERNKHGNLKLEQKLYTQLHENPINSNYLRRPLLATPPPSSYLTKKEVRLYIYKKQVTLIQ